MGVCALCGGHIMIEDHPSVCHFEGKIWHEACQVAVEREEQIPTPLGVNVVDKTGTREEIA